MSIGKILNHIRTRVLIGTLVDSNCFVVMFLALVCVKIEYFEEQQCRDNHYVKKNNTISHKDLSPKHEWFGFPENDDQIKKGHR